MSSYNYSYNVLINRFEAFAAGHLLIKRFTHGQIDLSDQLNDDQYPFMHVTPDTIEPVKGAMQFGFHIMFADIPRDKETKAEYQREVISDCVRLGQDLIAEIQNGLQLFGFNVQLINDVVFEPFMEEQKNTVTGVAFTVKLEVPWDWSACDIPAVWAVGGESTGGSGSPIGLLLQVNNVNNAVQSELDLVAGTNITLTDNGDGSVTIDSTGGGGGGSGTVTSVGLTAPAAFNVSGSPVTTSGTLAITAAGNNTQYIDGSGALQSFPAIPTVLDDLSDVNASSPNDGDILVYFSIGNEWKNQPQVSGGTVTSVGLSVPAPANPAFSVSGSPVTASGTLAISANGTSAQYIDGTGALQTFPAIPKELKDLISGTAAGQILEWDGTKWIVRSVFTLDELKGVNVPAPTNGQVLTFDTALNQWIASTPAAGGTVTSVGLSMPAAFTVTNSPVTTSGTLTVTGSGTSSQYIDGTGALQSFPALSGFVPYTGATQDVDLDTNKISARSVYIEGTAGNGHLHMKHQSADATATGQSTAFWADTNGDLKWKNDGNYKTTLKTSTNTADRVYTFPNETAELMPRNAAITPGTSTKVTYDADGLITSGTTLSAGDIPTALDATKIADGSVTNTEFQYLNGVTSAIQTQLNNKKDSLAYGNVYAATAGASSTVYGSITGITAFNATETNRHFAVPVAGTIKNFYVLMSGTQSATGSLVITIRNNASSSSVSVTVTNGDGASPTKSDNANTLAVSAGDKIAIQIVNNATATSASILSMAFIIERT